jgi:hypothetical protein
MIRANNIKGKLVLVAFSLKRLQLLPLLPMLLLFCSSCRTNRYYDYSIASKAYIGGEVRARLIGSFSTKGNTTTRSSPYDLVVFFIPNDKIDGYVAVKNIKLQADDENEITLNDEKQSKAQFFFDNIEYSARVRYNNLQLKFENYKLFLRFEVSSQGVNKNIEMNINLIKNYKEFISNDIWDGIMSV